MHPEPAGFPGLLALRQRPAGSLDGAANGSGAVLPAGESFVPENASAGGKLPEQCCSEPDGIGLPFSPVAINYSQGDGRKPGKNNFPGRP